MKFSVFIGRDINIQRPFKIQVAETKCHAEKLNLLETKPEMGMVKDSIGTTIILHL